MLKHATLKNLHLGLFTALDSGPVLAAREKRLHAICRSPVQVVFWIFAVSELCGDGNDALALVVGESDKNVNRARPCTLGPRSACAHQEHHTWENRKPDDVLCAHFSP